MITFFKYDCSSFVIRFKVNKRTEERDRLKYLIEYPHNLFINNYRFKACTIFYNDWFIASGIKTIPSLNTKSNIKKIPLSLRR